MHVPPNSVGSAEPNLKLIKKDAFVNELKQVRSGPWAGTVRVCVSGLLGDSSG